MWLFAWRDNLQEKSLFVICFILLVFISVLLRVSTVAADPISIQVIGGTPVDSTTYPWFASLRFRYKLDEPTPLDFHLCGGTLIAPNLVVTAAHCVYSHPFDSSLPLAYVYPEFTVVQFGRQVAYGEALWEREIEEVMLHPKWDPFNTAYDVALIRLKSEVPLVPMTPIYPLEFAELPPQTMAKLLGWGVINEELGVPSSTLREADLPLVSDTQCSEKNGAGFNPDSMFCAGDLNPSNPIDACYGDSGGPLLVQVDGSWRLAGIVSWGYGCGNTETYGVYSRVAAVHSFLTDVPSEFPPRPKTPPTLTGYTRKMLRCRDDEWHGVVRKRRYSWYRRPKNSYDHTPSTLIKRERKAYYKLKRGDKNFFIECAVYAENHGGRSYLPMLSQ